jgi:serine/threonine protein phosphatase PrpC
MRNDRTATLPLATIAAAGASDTGRQRETNEDRFYVDAGRGVFLVVDGVGGEAAGEVAAEIAVDTILDRLARRDGPPETRIREAITLANQQILQGAQGDPRRKGMACVLTLALLDGRQLTVGHVGDSRLYKLTPQGIAKLTHDHSPVGEREDARELSETQAMQHARRNEVYRDVGSESREPDAANFIEVVFSEFGEDAAILLCSDGLSDMVTSLEINRIVRTYAGDPDTAVRELIAAANAAGGKDNITVVLAAGRDFARHEPVTPIVSPPRPEPVARIEPPPPLAGAARTADPPGPAESAGGTAAMPRELRPGRSTLFRRLARSRALALVAGTLLGVSVALLPNMMEKAAGGRRLGVGGPSGEFRSISSALARAEAGDIVVVEPGEYAERLDLPPGVELVSRVPDAAILVAEATAAPWVSITARGGAGALRGFRVEGRADGTISIAVRLQGDGFEIDNATFDGAIETAVEIGERAGSSVVRGSRFSISGVPIRMAGAISPMIRRNVFIAAPEPRTPAIDAGGSGAPRLEDNLFVRFAQAVAPMHRDFSLQGNVVLPPAARR